MASHANIFKSIKDNLSLRRGRNTLFERTPLEVERGKSPTAREEVPAQVRRRFREQLTLEIREERRKWRWALLLGVIICLPVLYLLVKAVEVLDFWG
jgi:hypothetical protein